MFLDTINQTAEESHTTGKQAIQSTHLDNGTQVSYNRHPHHHLAYLFHHWKMKPHNTAVLYSLTETEMDIFSLSETEKETEMFC